MPYTPTGPAVRRTLIRNAGPQAAHQDALLRLYRLQTAQPRQIGAPILQADVVDQLQRAERLDGIHGGPGGE